MEIQPKVSESIPIESHQEQSKQTKESGTKKPRSEAQLAATAKALAAMTAGRKLRAIKQLEKKEEVKQAVKLVKQKIINEDLAFATRNDFDTLRKELADVRALYAESKQAQKVVVGPVPSVQKQERIVERIIERPTSNRSERLTGSALLDKVFGFDK